MDNVTLLRRIHDPYERGESEDFQPLWDIVADDVVYESPVGTVHGKQALIAYFDHVSETIGVWAFERPLEYFESAERVVMRGEERVTSHATGETIRGEWIWILDMPDGAITRIVHFLHFREPKILMDGLHAAYARTLGTVAGAGA